MKVVKAKVMWLSKEEGGRETIPSGGSYSTVACFEDIKERYHEEAWSVVLERNQLTNEKLCSICNIRFLVEWAPESLLYRGSKFSLLEGKQLVARCEIIG